MTHVISRNCCLKQTSHYGTCQSTVGGWYHLNMKQPWNFSWSNRTFIKLVDWKGGMSSRWDLLLDCRISRTFCYRGQHSHQGHDVQSRFIFNLWNLRESNHPGPVRCERKSNKLAWGVTKTSSWRIWRRCVPEPNRGVARTSVEVVVALCRDESVKLSISSEKCQTSQFARWQQICERCDHLIW